jgi:hypothetical protein
MWAPITKKYKSNTRPIVSEEWVIEKTENKTLLNSHRRHTLAYRVATVRKYHTENKDWLTDWGRDLLPDQNGETYHAGLFCSSDDDCMKGEEGKYNIGTNNACTSTSTSFIRLLINLPTYCTSCYITDTATVIARYWEKRDQLFPVFALLVNLSNTTAARRRQRSLNLKLSHGFWGSARSPPSSLTIKHDLQYFLPAFHWKSLSNLTHEKIHDWWGDS